MSIKIFHHRGVSFHLKMKFTRVFFHSTRRQTVSPRSPTCAPPSPRARSPGRGDSSRSSHCGRGGWPGTPSSAATRREPSTSTRPDRTRTLESSTLSTWRPSGNSFVGRFQYWTKRVTNSTIISELWIARSGRNTFCLWRPTCRTPRQPLRSASLSPSWTSTTIRLFLIR